MTWKIGLFFALRQEINGYAQAGNEQTHARIEGFGIEQNRADGQSGNDIEGWNDRITKRPIRSLGIGFGASEPKQSGNRDDIKQQRRKGAVIK